MLKFLGEPSKLHIEGCDTLWRIRNGNRNAMPPGTTIFAIVRWAALLWLLAWLPLYIWAWGWQNMLHICDVGLIVACFGLWFRQPLLISSQSLLPPLVGLPC